MSELFIKPSPNLYHKDSLLKNISSLPDCLITELFLQLSNESSNWLRCVHDFSWNFLFLDLQKTPNIHQFLKELTEFLTNWLDLLLKFHRQLIRFDHERINFTLSLLQKTLHCRELFLILSLFLVHNLLLLFWTFLRQLLTFLFKLLLSLWSFLFLLLKLRLKGFDLRLLCLL